MLINVLWLIPTALGGIVVGAIFFPRTVKKVVYSTDPRRLRELADRLEKSE